MTQHSIKSLIGKLEKYSKDENYENVFFSREAIDSSGYFAPMCLVFFLSLFVDSQIAFQIVVCGSLYLLWQISSLNSPPPKCCISFILITSKQHKFFRG